MHRTGQPEAAKSFHLDFTGKSSTRQVKPLHRETSLSLSRGCSAIWSAIRSHHSANFTQKTSRAKTHGQCGAPRTRSFKATEPTATAASTGQAATAPAAPIVPEIAVDIQCRLPGRPPGRKYRRTILENLDRALDVSLYPPILLTNCAYM